MDRIDQTVQSYLEAYRQARLAPSIVGIYLTDPAILTDYAKVLNIAPLHYGAHLHLVWGVPVYADETLAPNIIKISYDDGTSEEHVY